VVAMEAIQGGRGQEAFYSTCSTATAEQVVGWYAMRWSIEVYQADYASSARLYQLAA